MDLFSLGLGFTAGVALTAVAANISMPTRIRNPETTKVAASWALSEVSPGTPPAVVAERIEDLPVPRGAHVLVPVGASGAVPPAVLRDCDVRMHPDVGSNYVLGRDRALVFSSHIHPRAHAVYTREESAVKRLQEEFTAMWVEADPYVERTSIESLASKENRFVEFTGTAAELVEFRGRRMLRVSDKGASIGVISHEANVAELQGKPVVVTGRVSHEGGLLHVEARSLTRAAPGGPLPG